MPLVVTASLSAETLQLTPCYGEAYLSVTLVFTTSLWDVTRQSIMSAHGSGTFAWFPLKVLTHPRINHLKPKTLCTTGLNIKKLCTAHNAFVCFTWISEQTAIIYLYSINLSVFIMEAVSAYCAVRTGFLNQADTLSSLKG